MGSLATKINMGTRVHEAADIKSDSKLNLLGYWGCLEAIMASEAI